MAYRIESQKQAGTQATEYFVINGVGKVVAGPFSTEAEAQAEKVKLDRGLGR